jgi:hypothetical protein
MCATNECISMVEAALCNSLVYHENPPKMRGPHGMMKQHEITVRTMHNETLQSMMKLNCTVTLQSKISRIAYFLPYYTT